ncbi:MAG: polysaccharide deacetylase family protein [Nibricoccus sp.]
MSISHDRSYITFQEAKDTLESGLAVLTYHKIARRPAGTKVRSIYLSPSDFSTQLRDLANAGFTSTNLDAERPASAGNPARQIVLTFDDGYLNVLKNAAPLLARHNFTATQFLVADLLGQNNRWDIALGEVPEPLMDAAQIRDWLALGHDIGAHTLTHPHLTHISLDAAREEIFSSKKKLEDLFGRPIRHFCYPYGEWNEAIADLVREAGYTTATTTQWGANTASTPPFALHRLNTRYRSRNVRTVLQSIARALKLRS